MPEKTEKKLRKPWVVYSYIGRIGKIESENYNSVHIRYSEGQLFPLELWDSHYVKRFDTPLGAIEYFVDLLEYNRNDNRNKLIKKFLSDFPNEKSNLEKLLAQSQPKCRKTKLKKSKSLEKLERLEDFDSPDDLDYA